MIQAKSPFNQELTTSGEWNKMQPAIEKERESEKLKSTLWKVATVVAIVAVAALVIWGFALINQSVYNSIASQPYRWAVYDAQAAVTLLSALGGGTLLIALGFGSCFAYKSLSSAINKIRGEKTQKIQSTNYTKKSVVLKELNQLRELSFDRIPSLTKELVSEVYVKYGFISSQLGNKLLQLREGYDRYQKLNKEVATLEREIGKLEGEKAANKKAAEDAPEHEIVHLANETIMLNERIEDLQKRLASLITERNSIREKTEAELNQCKEKVPKLDAVLTDPPSFDSIVASGKPVVAAA